jgi:outer membrane protein
MRFRHWPRTAALVFLATAHPVRATDLMDAWRAAQSHDLDYIAAASEHHSGAALDAQGDALWHPTVQVTGTAGRMSGDTAIQGAQFSAPGLASTAGVSFNTSVNDGNMERWNLEARQPLINRERTAQSQQLHLKAEATNLEWQIAGQALILRTAGRYFDVVLAEEALDVAKRQKQSIEKSLGEIKSRFDLGDIPVTDVHEATARMEAIQAQIMAAETDLQLKTETLADATGLSPDTLKVAQPLGDLPPAGKNLDEWLSASRQGNPQLRLAQTEAAIAREESARYGALSNVSLDLVGEVAHDRLSGQGDYGSASNTSHNALLGIQLTLPLYTGGYQGARKSETAALAEKALNQSDRTRQQIALQTRSAWLGVEVGNGRIVALAASLEASESRLAATRTGYQVGDRSTLDVLNAENDAANARLSWMQARVALVMDRLRLAALAGKLEQDQLQAINAVLQTAVADGKSGSTLSALP